MAWIVGQNLSDCKPAGQKVSPKGGGVFYVECYKIGMIGCIRVTKKKNKQTNGRGGVKHTEPEV